METNEHECDKDCVVDYNAERTQKCIHHNDGGVTIEDINQNGNDRARSTENR